MANDSQSSIPRYGVDETEGSLSNSFGLYGEAEDLHSSENSVMSLSTIVSEWIAAKISEEIVKSKINSLKYNLEGWREVLIHIHSVLTWKRSFYPLVLWAIVSTFFGIVYYCKLSALTTLATLGIFVILSDYFVPIAQVQLFDPNLWTGAKEKKYEELCQGIVSVQDQFYGVMAALYSLKRTRPAIYFVTIIISLLMVAWLGSLMDNLLLTYIIVCIIVMLPGLAHKGYLQKLMAIGMRRMPKSKKKK